MAHSTNGGKPIDLFHWYEDGQLRTTFEGASSRDGDAPDELVPLLREVGFPLTAEGAHDENAPGVRVTETLLRDATYELGLVPEQPADASVVITDNEPPTHGAS